MKNTFVQQYEKFTLAILVLIVENSSFFSYLLNFSPDKAFEMRF